MKAVVWTKYGSPEGLQVQEVNKPIPEENEVLIRIHATTVTAGDVEVRTMKIPSYLRIPMRFYVGLWKPKRMTILGQELAGEIEAVGKDVTRFKPGDQVFGATGFGLGGYAEYKCMPEAPEDGVLVIKPEELSYEEAAAIPIGGLEALHFIRAAEIREGESVLIVGSGGSIGTMGVQLAKYYGGVVTGVDRESKFEMLRSIGADHVIDYTREDFTKKDISYDVIFDVIGKAPYPRCIRSLKTGGRYVTANPSFLQMVRGSRKLTDDGKKIITGTTSFNTEDLMFLKELIVAGTIKPVIGRTFPLEQTAEAHRYVETGQKVGNVVITVNE